MAFAKSVVRLIGTLLVAASAACSPRPAPVVAPRLAPEVLASRLAEAERLASRGCYRCLKEAAAAYAALLAETDDPKAITGALENNLMIAMREIELDVAEGADMIMVKPALPYLDLVRQARDRFDLPLAAYNVSGEYAMLKAAVQLGWLEERRAVLELLTGIKRAGADMIITYHAREASQWLTE